MATSSNALAQSDEAEREREQKYGEGEKDEVHRSLSTHDYVGFQIRAKRKTQRIKRASRRIDSSTLEAAARAS